LFVEVAMKNLMEGSLSASCWCSKFATRFLEVQGLWGVDLQWSLCVVRWFWICEGGHWLC